jgi:hypothetical protein
VRETNCDIALSLIIHYTMPLIMQQASAVRPCALAIARRRCEDNIKTDIRKSVWKYAFGLCGSGQAPVAASSEHGIETSGSINSDKFLNQLNVL